MRDFYRSALVHHTLNANEAVRRLELNVLERQRSRVRRENRSRSLAASEKRKRRMLRGESPRTGLMPCETVVISQSCGDIPQLTYSQKVQEHRKLSDFGVIPHILIDEEDANPRPTPAANKRQSKRRFILERIREIRKFFRMPTKKKASLPPTVPIIKEDDREEKETSPRKSISFCENTCEVLRRSFRKAKKSPDSKEQ